METLLLFYYMVQDHILTPGMLSYHGSARSDYSWFSSAYIRHQQALKVPVAFINSSKCGSAGRIFK